MNAETVQAGRIVKETWKTKFVSSCSGSIFSKANNPNLPNRQINVLMTILQPNARYPFQGAMSPGNVPDDVTDINAGICLQSIREDNSLAASMLKALYEKSFSFWFDTSLRQDDLEANPEIQTGEVSISGKNFNRFRNNGLSVLFNVNSQDSRNANSDTWTTGRMIPVRVAGKTTNQFVTFDIGRANTRLPKSLLTHVVGNTIKSTRFNCSAVQTISGFKIGTLEIPAEFLYDKLRNNQCILRVSPQPEGSENSVLLGFHQIKNFYFTVNYDYRRGTTVEFNERLEKTVGNPSCNGCCTIC